MGEDENYPHNLRQLSQYHFERTKWWWWFSLILKIAAFAIGLPTIFWPQSSVWIAGIVAVLLFSSEASSIRSNYFKGMAESLLRKLDLKDSFGWPVSEIEIADSFVSLPERVQKRLDVATKADGYFASHGEPGWQRGMRNLQESAWWSKHLARCMGKYCLCLTIALVGISLAILILSGLLVSSTEPLTSINRVVISSLLLIVSLGLIPLIINYYSFGLKAERSVSIATNLLKSSEVDNESQAIKALNEYHLARAAAPLIPTRLWQAKREYLNRTWKRFVANQ